MFIKVKRDGHKRQRLRKPSLSYYTMKHSVTAFTEN